MHCSCAESYYGKPTTESQVACHVSKAPAYLDVALRLLQTTLAAVLVTAPTLTLAQASPYRLPSDTTLSQLVSDSLSVRPEIAAGDADVKAQAARVPQVGAMPDPTLQVGIQNDGFSDIQIGKMETSWVSIMLSQTLPWPGKRALRSDIARLEKTSTERTVDRLRLSTEADVRRLYVQLVWVRDRLALLARLTSIWQGASETAKIVYESGGGSQSDLLRARLELSRLKQRQIALSAQEQSLVQELNRLRAQPLDQPITTKTHLADLGLPTLFDKQQAVEDAMRRSPELAAARNQIISQERYTALVSKLALPDFTVAAGIMPRGTSLPPMWLLSVSAPIPIFSAGKQNHAVHESRARSESAQANSLAIEQLLQLRVSERHAALLASTETLSIYDAGLLLQSRATQESTLAQYRVGKASFASVLEANAGVLADEEGYLSTLAESYFILISAHEVSLAALSQPNSGSTTGSSMPTASVSSRPGTEARTDNSNPGGNSGAMTGGM
jgi:outer membrane protein TolC